MIRYKTTLNHLTKRLAQLLTLAVVYEYTLPTIHADLVLALAGSTGSSTIQYTASGSIGINDSIEGVTTPAGNAPLVPPAREGNPPPPSWSAQYDTLLGDFLVSGATPFSQAAVLSNGGVSYRQNGIEFGVLSTVSITPSNFTGEDGLGLDHSNTVTYPSLTAGDTVSWEGSGSFELPDGYTFDTLFAATGSFSNAIVGGDYIVTITAVPVPEPKTYGLLTALGLGIVVGIHRRRGQIATTAS